MIIYKDEKINIELIPNKYAKSDNFRIEKRWDARRILRKNRSVYKKLLDILHKNEETKIFEDSAVGKINKQIEDFLQKGKFKKLIERNSTIAEFKIKSTKNEKILEEIRYSDKLYNFIKNYNFLNKYIDILFNSNTKNKEQALKVCYSCLSGMNSLNEDEKIMREVYAWLNYFKRHISLKKDKETGELNTLKIDLSNFDEKKAQEFSQNIENAVFFKVKTSYNQPQNNPL